MFRCIAAASIAFGVPPIGKYTDVHTAPFHPSIHNLGNVGFWGRAHAQGAWIATHMIDRIAYKGCHMRRELAIALADEFRDEATSVLEVGCGVGTLTRELDRVRNFNVTAIDTSQDMLDVACRWTASRLLCVNVVDHKETSDVTVVCMVMHEMSPSAHVAVLDALKAITRKKIWIIDIDTVYEPSLLMLSGEPYVPDYLRTFEDTLRSAAAPGDIDTYALIPGHVRVWKLGVEAT